MSNSAAGTQAAQRQASHVDSPLSPNRIVTFLSPVIAVVAGAAAAWLLRHFPGIHIARTTLATTIAQATAFAVTAIGTFAVHHKWLSGWQQYEQSLVPGTPAPVQTPWEVAAQLVPILAALGAVGAPSTGTAAGGGQPLGGAGLNGSSGAALTDGILPGAAEEMASVPSGPNGGTPSQRPESAVKPDVPTSQP